MALKEGYMKLLGNYTLTEKIGEGSSSQVFLAFKHPEHTPYALKSISKEHLKDPNNLRYHKKEI